MPVQGGYQKSRQSRRDARRARGLAVTEGDKPWARDWHVGVRVWVERHGQTVLGEGRLELLEWIERCHSISEAARQLGISYRHAWVTVQAVNDAAGKPLVTAMTGGRRGGGARLTPSGAQAVALFRQLQDQVQHAAVALLPRLVAVPASRTIHVAAAVSLEEVLSQLVTDYALRQQEVRIRLILGASDELTDQIERGASVDLFLSADAGQLKRLAAAGFARGPLATLADNGLAAIAPGEDGFTARKPADLLSSSSGCQRIAMATAGCPLGGYTRDYLQALGLYERFHERAVEVENSRAVFMAVQAKQADAGFIYSSATLAAHGCRVLFRVRRLPTPIRYAGVVLAHAREPEFAQEFLSFLVSKQAERRFRRWGFMPATAEQ
jgi:molybdenum ABC transporter molybdate-binding protein